MKLRILHVVPTYWPATYWGGPIFSTKAICDGLAARPDMEVRVLTTDSAGPGQAPAAAGPVEGDRYPVLRTRRVAGVSISPGLLARLPGEIQRADLVHITSAYSFPTLPALAAARLARRPVVWSPRGALQATADWAGAPRRGVKQAFERAAQIVRPANTVLHVTSPDEGERSLRNLPGLDTVLIPNSVEVPAALPARQWRPNGQLRLLFLSRLHEKKGIDLLLDAVAALPGWVSLDIHGDGDAAYVTALRQRIGANPRVRLLGAADEARKRQAFAAADLFVLPSWSENFGIVVAEALAHGVPVLTTNRTPWQGLERHGCGLCVEPDAGELAAAITKLATQDLAAMGQRGREWVRRDYSAAAMCDAFAALYHRMAGASAVAPS